MPRPQGTADLLEDRRRRALALLDSGYSLNEVGRRIGCGASSVMGWRDARRRGGEKALRVRYSPGRSLKLNQAQRKGLVRLLLQGPMAHGYRTNLWTTARIAEVIQHKFGVQYHRDHVGRLMHSLQWSPQKPERRALGRDEKAIARGKQKDWPRIKKRLARVPFRGRIFLPMATHNHTLEYLTTTKIGEKGQLTVPKQFREDLGLGNGAPFAVLRLGDGLILLPEQQRFEQMCQQVSSSLTAAGLTSGDLLATLPEARNRVYARRYGKKAPATAFRRRSRSYRGK